MTNEQIIYNATRVFLGIDEATAGQLLMAGQFPAFHTYEAWKEIGYQVQKGQKASFSASIWKMTEKKNDEGERVQKLIMKNAYFFGRDQVKPIERK